MRTIIPICLVLLLSSCSSDKKETGNQDFKVTVGEAKSFSSTDDRRYTFSTKPYNTSQLSFRVGGPVVKFDVHPGQYYRKGQLIAAIDNRDFIIRKEQTKAVFQQTENEFIRISNLYHKGNVSGSRYEKTHAEYVTAKTAYETATNELNDTYMKAPFDGFIQSVEIEKYQDVRPSQTVVTFIDITKLKAETYIPEQLAIELGKAAKNSIEVSLAFDKLPEKKMTTRDITVSQSTTYNNLSYLLTAIIDNEDYSLLGGMTGSLVLPSSKDSSKASIFVPQQAVCNQPQKGTYVWVLRGNKTESVSVKLGDLHRDNLVEIVSGLQENDKVVTSNTNLLFEGREVSSL